MLVLAVVAVGDTARTPAWLPDDRGLGGTVVNAGWIIPATVAAICEISSGNKRLLAGAVLFDAGTITPDETGDGVETTGAEFARLVSLVDVAELSISRS